MGSKNTQNTQKIYLLVHNKIQKYSFVFSNYILEGNF
jgi:hypothetical protein